MLTVTSGVRGLRNPTSAGFDIQNPDRVKSDYHPGSLRTHANILRLLLRRCLMQRLLLAGKGHLSRNHTQWRHHSQPRSLGLRQDK